MCATIHINRLRKSLNIGILQNAIKIEKHDLQATISNTTVSDKIKKNTFLLKLHRSDIQLITDVSVYYVIRHITIPKLYFNPTSMHPTRVFRSLPFFNL